MKSQRSNLKKKSKKPKNDIVNIELDIKCSCSKSASNENAIIQFTRRYLRCQKSMPISIIRLFIETILFYSPTTKILIYDMNNQLLKDSDRLRSLKHVYASSSSSSYIPLRFALTNAVTSLPNCSCLLSTVKNNASSLCLPITIQQNNIERILSTLSFCSLSSSLPNVSSNTINFSHSRYCISKFVDYDPETSTTNQIVSEFGEICQASTKRKRNHESKNIIPEVSLDMPLDLRIKKNL